MQISAAHLCKVANIARITPRYWEHVASYKSNVLKASGVFGHTDVEGITGKLGKDVREYAANQVDWSPQWKRDCRIAGCPV